MVDKQLLNLEYLSKNIKRLSQALFFPLLIMTISIFILIRLETSKIYGFKYLFLFLTAIIAAIYGSIKSFLIIIRLMKKDFKENKILKRTNYQIKHSISHRVFYWGYGIVAILGLITAIITGNEDDLNFFIFPFIIGIIIFEIYRKFHYKTNTN